MLYVASKKRTSSKIRAFCLVQLKKNVLFNLLSVLDLYTKGPARREGHTVRAKHIRHQLTSPVYRSRLHEEWPRLNTALGTSKWDNDWMINTKLSDTHTAWTRQRGITRRYLLKWKGDAPICSVWKDGDNVQIKVLSVSSKGVGARTSKQGNVKWYTDAIALGSFPPWQDAKILLLTHLPR